MRYSGKTFGFALGVALLLLSAPAHSANVAYVSVTGNDVGNDCDDVLDPCRQISVAAGVVDPGGQVIVLTSGRYGASNVASSISDAVTIVADGVDAVITAIVISADPTDVVTIRGLTIDPTGLAGDALKFVSGRALRLENCIIRGSPDALGINFIPGTASELYVHNSTIADNLGASGGGVRVKPGVSGSAKVTLDDVRIENNRIGVLADGTGSSGSIRVLLRDTVVVDSATIGISALETATAIAPTSVSLEQSTVANSGTHGIFASRVVTVRAQQSSITGNANGLTSVNGGQIVSHGGNTVAGNTTNGAFTSTVPPL